MLRWASAVLTAVLIAALAFGLWWVASPGLAEGDRLAFAVLLVLFGMMSGVVAYGQGLWAGHDSERDAARRAAAELHGRRDRMEAQLAARRAERDQILASAAQNPRLAGENPRLTGGPPP
ncbi:MAG: hypothetical protein ACRDE9_07430 [Candidatus Limnocylindria bacterium]